MPPTKKLPSRPRPSDGVTNLLNRLPNSVLPPQDRRESITKQTNEFLRIIATKIRVGALGRYDTIENRTAVALEYAVREGGMKRIPEEALAKSCGMKRKAFEELHQKIGHHLPRRRVEMRGGGPARTTTALDSSAPSSREPKRTTSSSSADMIGILSIKFGSRLPDSHGVAAKARDLFAAIEHSMKASNLYTRKDSLNELKRHRRVYEAACFYVSGKEDCASQKRKGKRAGNKRRKSQEEEDHDEPELAVSDVVDASGLPNGLFQDILYSVQTTATKLKQLEQQQTNAGKRPGHVQKGGMMLVKDQQLPLGGFSFSSSSSAQTFLAASQKDGISRSDLEHEPQIKRIRNSITGKSMSTKETMLNQSCDDSIVQAPTQVDEELARPKYSDKFLQWKEQVLSTAVEAARRRMVKSAKDDGEEKENISYSDALERAANDTLQRWGL